MTFYRWFRSARRPATAASWNCSCQWRAGETGGDHLERPVAGWAYEVDLKHASQQLGPRETVLTRAVRLRLAVSVLAGRRCQVAGPGHDVSSIGQGWSEDTVHRKRCQGRTSLVRPMDLPSNVAFQFTSTVGWRSEWVDDGE